MDYYASSSCLAETICNACQGFTLAGFRNAFRVQTLHEFPVSLIIRYPDIRASAGSCRMCALILAEVKSRTGIPAFFSSAITTRWWSEYTPRDRPLRYPDDIKLVDAVMYMVEGEGGSELFDACTLTISADEGG